VRRSVAALACCAGFGLFGCRTLPPAPGWQPLATDDPRSSLCVAALGAQAEARRALRATARVRSEGPDGGAFFDQLLLAERPARLRVEVLGGVLHQRVLVLATDGERYELYRAEDQSREEGVVHPGVLEEVAGLPLTPDAAVSLLLAAPRAPSEPAERAEQDGAGALRLAWPDQTLECDARGRLQALAFHPGEREVLHARWSDWRGPPGAEFPYRLELELPESASRLALEFRQVELDPALDPALFRLGLGTR
jgi:hypothetical protein